MSFPFFFLFFPNVDVRCQTVLGRKRKKKQKTEEEEEEEKKVHKEEKVQEKDL